jgi:dUTP pyrophosphatase
MSLTIKFLKTHPVAVLPSYAHEHGDAGFDLYAVEDTLLRVGKATLVRTGLVLADSPLVDEKGNSYFFDVRSRSGLSKNLVFPVTGTVDVNYRGEIFVVLANLGGEDYQVKARDRIAQMVIQQIMAPTPYCNITFEEAKKVEETVRGAGGFGSTGR